jgi:hypothetical protein
MMVDFSLAEIAAIEECFPSKSVNHLRLVITSLYIDCSPKQKKSCLVRAKPSQLLLPKWKTLR